MGFDTETRPNFSKTQHHKMALIQLSTPDRCYLFRLNKLGGIPPQLEDFLKNGKTIKIGLSLLDDFHNIRKYIDFKPDNFIDLQKVVPLFGIQEASLQKIYAILFGKKISKRMRLSNWEISELTEAQKQYAALDAWACLQIYQYLYPSL
jgi:ribonuclease D